VPAVLLEPPAPPPLLGFPASPPTAPALWGASLDEQAANASKAMTEMSGRASMATSAGNF